MARTIKQIYEEIITEKETKTSLSGLLPGSETYQGLLDDLTSGSKVAVWRLWAYTIAVAHYVHETLFDLFIIEANAIAAAAPAGTPAWYQKKMFEFQFGDLLVYLNNQYVYNPVNPANQIVKRCAIEERPDGIVLIKVAKEVSGVITPLTTPEKDGLTSYAKKIKFAGTRIAIVSIDPDVITLSYDIYFDPQIPLIDIQAATETAMANFLASLPFNAAFNITDFTDVLQGIPGILDPVYLSSSNMPDGGTDTSFAVEVIPAAGWFVYNDTAENMFNWIAQI